MAIIKLKNNRLFAGTFPVLIFSLLVLMGALSNCSSETRKTKSFKSVFDQYRVREDVVAISFPPGLVGIFLSDDDPEQAELKKLMQELSAFRMLTVEEPQTPEQSIPGDKDTAADLRLAINNFTSENEFEDLFRIQSNGQDIFLRILEKDGKVKEAVLMMNAEGSLFVIDLKGNISLHHFTKLVEEGHLMGLTDLSDISF